MKKLLALLALLSLCVPALCADPTMAELNPEFEARIVNALKPSNAAYKYREETQPLSLFFFSDIHGDALEFARLAAFYAEYGKYFDGAICTGDLIKASYAEPFDYWGKTPGHEKIMNIIGNHDTLRDHKGWKNADWNDQISMGEAYERYMAPYIAGWDVTYEVGKTYYYKDYDAKKIRMIVIDCMLRPEIDKKAEAGQFRWFKETLAGAKEKDLSVIIACHFPMRKNVALKCNFSEYGRGGGAAWYDVLNNYQEAVDLFMKSGGKFVCWFGGHTHKDLIDYNPAYPDQLDVIVSAAGRRNCDQYSDMSRIDGTKSMDLADALIIDTSTSCVKIIRIGANTDSHQVQRNGITINYKTKEIYSQY